MLPLTRVPTARHRAALEEFAAFDVVDRLDDIAVPTLVVCGRHDPIIPAWQCALLARIPRAEVVVFEESGHDIAADEPEKFGATVRQFVTEHVERDL
jgi:proline iminopeptidase